jgi:hypothetical protein
LGIADWFGLADADEGGGGAAGGLTGAGLDGVGLGVEARVGFVADVGVGDLLQAGDGGEACLRGRDGGAGIGELLHRGECLLDAGLGDDLGELGVGEGVVLEDGGDVEVGIQELVY